MQQKFVDIIHKIQNMNKITNNKTLRSAEHQNKRIIQEYLLEYNYCMIL
ncbi:hypothetical protein pb186bvf_012169 [Paramecium bursaria]